MKDNLRKQLLKEGAGKNEAENLARLSVQLHQVRPRGLSARAKQRMYDELPINAPKERQPIIRWAFAGSLAGAMAIVGLLVVPGILRPDAAPADDGVRTLVQPVESELQELEMHVEELQHQETIDEVELQEAEEKYQRTFEHYKRQYERNEQFRNYDWDKWRRDFHKNDKDKNHETQVNGASTNPYNSWNRDHR